MRTTLLYVCCEKGLLSHGRPCTFATTDIEEAKAHDTAHFGLPANASAKLSHHFMREATLYICCEQGLLPRGRFCTFCTTDYEAAKAHEAAHRGMTVQEYDEWLRFYKEVQDAGKNREIDNAHKSTFEQACALLLEFEEQHPAVSSVIPFEFRKEEP